MPLQIFQSMWAMEGLPWGSEHEWSIDEKLDRIRLAGFEGVSVSFHDPGAAAEISGLAKDKDLKLEVVCYPASPDEFRGLLDFIHTSDISNAIHINMQPMLRTNRLGEATIAVNEWYADAAEAGVELLIETHRGRLTNDLLFTLDLLAEVPQLQLTADLSHYVVGHEFAWPVPEIDEEKLHRIMERSGAYHGRVASPGQIQLQTSFSHSKQWLDTFARWWRWGFAHALASGHQRLVTFTTELGPPEWYAVIGADGKELSDRWEEALSIKQLARTIWDEEEARANGSRSRLLRMGDHDSGLRGSGQ